MRYEKKPLTFEEQAGQLIQRGLEADRYVLIQRLQAVNYYRLSGYLYPFRDTSDTFKPGTNLDEVWDRYTFDRQLRLLTLDAIERVEISLRTSLADEHSHRHGPFGYISNEALPGLDSDRFRSFLSQLKDEMGRSREAFVTHFKDKYGDKHHMLPLWMAVEIMPFGGTLTLYKGVEKATRQAVAEQYNVPDTVLMSWLGTLNVTRNICAHHGRLCGA